MFIFDTAKRQKVKFKPIKKGEVTIYVCGPTVYDDAHLGHARSAIAFDLLRRVFEALKFKVIFVKNFTDIDDKIIAKMAQSGQSLEEITKHYISRYKNDMKVLLVKEPDIEPKATQNLEAMISLIERLLESGNAYETKEGVYFDTTKDSSYLSLSNQYIEETRARIKNDDEKRNPKDFALWKRADDSPNFESPFGLGRPGWHIECSAMINAHIAHSGKYQIDIHAGGADLLFPHHENEAAQTRCGLGQEIAKYWMHNGFVTIDGEKMSKSLGNSFFIKDALKVYEGEVLRFYLLSTHYRSDFNFNEVDLLASKRRLDKLYRLKKRVYDFKALEPNQEFEKEMLQALSDDLNISKALAVLDEAISNINDNLDKDPKNKGLKASAKGVIAWTKSTLGIGYMDAFNYFQLGVSEDKKAYIQSQIELRNIAKTSKDFAKADAIRDLLAKEEIILMDTANGTQWEKRSS